MGALSDYITTVGDPMAPCILILKVWNTYQITTAKGYCERLLESQKAAHIKITTYHDYVEVGCKSLYYNFQ